MRRGTVSFEDWRMQRASPPPPPEPVQRRVGYLAYAHALQP